MKIEFFYVVTLAFVVATGLGTVLALAQPYILFIVLLGMALLALSYIYPNSSQQILIFVVAGCLLAGGLGLWRAQIAVEKYANSGLHSKVGEEIKFVGEVVREPDEREKNTHLYVKVKEGGDVVLVSVDRYGELSYGDTVMVRGKVTLPEAFVTDLGRIFLYPQYLKAKGVQFSISFAQVEVLERGGGNPVLAGLLEFKQAFVSKLGTVLSEPESGLGVGLLLGVKQALGEELEQAFRKTGIIHIVVLSGYNVMLVVTFVLFVLGIFLPFTARAVFGILAIVLFALLVGLSPTVVRASIMASLVLLAPLLGRRYSLMRALVLAGSVMVFVNPYILLFDVGFQLSFLATLGLILVAPQFELMLIRAPNTLKLREFFIATLATQVAVAPLLLYQIGELSLIALVVNMLVLPMVGIAMLLTFVTGMLAFVNTTIASVVAVPTYLALFYIIYSAEWFASMPYISVQAPPFSVWLLVLSYSVMFGLWYWLTKRKNITKKSAQLNNQSLSQKERVIKEFKFTDWEIKSEAELITGIDKELSKPIQTEPVTKKQINNTSQKHRLAKTEVPIFFR